MFVNLIILDLFIQTISIKEHVTNAVKKYLKTKSVLKA